MHMQLLHVGHNFTILQFIKTDGWIKFLRDRFMLPAFCFLSTAQTSGFDSTMNSSMTEDYSPLGNFCSTQCLLKSEHESPDSLSRSAFNTR